MSHWPRCPKCKHSALVHYGTLKCHANTFPPCPCTMRVVVDFVPKKDDR